MSTLGQVLLCENLRISEIIHTSRYLLATQDTGNGRVPHELHSLSRCGVRESRNIRYSPSYKDTTSGRRLQWCSQNNQAVSSEQEIFIIQQPTSGQQCEYTNQQSQVLILALGQHGCSKDTACVLCGRNYTNPTLILVLWGFFGGREGLGRDGSNLCHFMAQHTLCVI